jgi:TRAP-type mannitol/chloroaromatic compound transport system substrate-binding protein
MTKRRDFLKRAGVATVAAAASTTIAAPYVKAQSPIKWRMQTYAGPALSEHVIKNSIDAFNKAANGEMEIELYNADQLVPHGELFRAMQAGTIDAVQSDDDSIAAPVDVSVFGAYFPFASRYSLDVPTLWNWYGLKEIWEEAYSKVEGVTWLSTGSWDPCNFATTKPIRSLKDLEGLRVYMFPTGGRFMSRFGVVPVALPYSDVEVAIQTGELDGVCWSGITEVYTVGWSNVTKYYLTNNLSGAWAGSYFVNSARWAEVPAHLQQLFRMTIDSSHYYRLHWYWWGEAHYRTTGGKLELTSIPQAEWATVEKAALEFWDEIAAEKPTNA